MLQWHDGKGKGMIGKVLTTEEENTAAIKASRASLMGVEASTQDELEWFAASGNKYKLPTYLLSTDYGEIKVALPARPSHNRVPHLFHLQREEGPLRPDVEASVPLGYDRQKSGVYVQQENQVWLCLRGVSAGCKEKVKQQAIDEYFAEWSVEVDDNGTLATVLAICALPSTTFVDEVGYFVSAVKDFKKWYELDQI